VSITLVTILARRPPAQAATTSHFFTATGYSIDNPSFVDYFDKRGGIATFGYPASRTFTFRGFPVQLFQRAIMQRYPDGHVQLLNLLDPELFPYTQVNGAIFPGVDPDLTSTAPGVGSADYGSAVLTWLATVAPDT